MTESQEPKVFHHHDEDDGIMGRSSGFRLFNPDTGHGLHVGVGRPVREVRPEEAIRGRMYGIRLGRLAVGFGPKVKDQEPW